MKQFLTKNLPYIIIAAAVVAVAVFVVIYALRPSAASTPEVVLPSPVSGVGASASPEGGGSPDETLLDVSAQNVQTVLASISRPESYSRVVRVQSFWDGGESERVISVWIRGEALRLTDERDGETRQLLISGGEMFIWYDGAPGYYSGPAAGEADEYQSMLTYEDVLSLDADAILDAAASDYDGEPCVFVRYAAGSLGYEYELYVSAATGLLAGAEIYDGDELIYRMSSVSTDISTPDDDVFSPPEE